MVTLERLRGIGDPSAMEGGAGVDLVSGSLVWRTRSVTTHEAWIGLRAL